MLGRNRFVFSSLEADLKEREMSFYKTFSAAPYQSESEVVEEFELTLRLLANPRDRFRTGETRSRGMFQRESVMA